MRLILARVLWNFDLELMPESNAWNEQKILSFWDKGPLNVRLKRVERPQFAREDRTDLGDESAHVVAESL